MNTVKLLALSFSLAGSLPRSGSSGFDYRGYWRHSVTTAVATRALARLVKHPFTEEAFVCGLFDRIGQLIMASAIPVDYDRVLEQAESTLPSTDDEHRVLGYNHRQVASVILRSWQLPNLIVGAVLHSAMADSPADEFAGQLQTLCRLLRIADVVGRFLWGDSKADDLNKIHQLAVRHFGLSDAEMDLLIVSLQQQIRETAALLNVEADDTVDYQSILDEARQQILQISLGTAADLRASKSRAQQLEQQKQDLEKIAHTDQLTQIPNRAHFDAVLASIINSRLAGHSEKSLGLLILDIDYFKSCNDNYGHALGDRVLERVASWLKESTRSTDFVARYGGEEFVVILPNTHLSDLEGIAERLRLCVESSRVQHNQEQLSVTISLGGACINRITTLLDGELLLQLADECLYEAKRGGRNCWVCREAEAISIPAGTVAVESSASTPPPAFCR